MKLLNYTNLNAHSGRPGTPLGKYLTLWHTSESFCIAALKVKAVDSVKRAERA